MFGSIIRTDGGYGVPGMPGNNRVNSPVRFDPRNLNVQPLPGYNLRPGYVPTRGPIERDKFILHSPKSGVAGNPFGSDFVIPSQRQNPADGGPQLTPLQQTPTRVFPPTAPGREGAIDVQFRQALGGFSPVGNVGALAQAHPGASALGGQMGINMGMPGMPAPNVFSVRPRVSYREPEEGGLDLGGSVNIPIGKEGRINVQGGYQPETNMMNLQGTIGQPPGRQGFGLDFFINRNLNRKPAGQFPMPGMFNDMGGQIRYDTQF